MATANHIAYVYFFFCIFFFLKKMLYCLRLLFNIKYWPSPYPSRWSGSQSHAISLILSPAHCTTSVHPQSSGLLRGFGYFQDTHPGDNSSPRAAADNTHNKMKDKKHRETKTLRAKCGDRIFGCRWCCNPEMCSWNDKSEQGRGIIMATAKVYEWDTR